MEGGGSKNRLFQILGWEEKAKARDRRDGEKEEFPRRLGTGRHVAGLGTGARRFTTKQRDLF